jgi:hypothetical protein
MGYIYPRFHNHQLRELISVLILTCVPYIVWVGQTYAISTLTPRSVEVSSSIPSAVANENFEFQYVSPDAVGSVVLQYCSNSPLFDDPCDAPVGLSASDAGLVDQNGNTGFSIDETDSTPSEIVLSRPAAVPNTAVVSNYQFWNITNPSATNQTVYVRMTTFSSSDGTGSYIDRGAVAFSTTSNLEVGAFVPPFINICVGVTVAQDCSQSQGTSLDMGDLSPRKTGTATSQYAVATNDQAGNSVYVLGTTMTSGNNIIESLNKQTGSETGESEFGLNLMKNSNPNIGDDPAGAGTSIPATGYNTPNLFNFVPGSEISNSDFSTQYNKMTVSYIANVSNDQPAGVYTTTLIYLASGQF